MPSTPYPYDPENFPPPLDWRRKWPRPLTPWFILCGTLLFFGAVDFSFCWIASDKQSTGFWQYCLAFNIGAVGAQGGLLAIYAVFGPQPVLERHLIAITVGLIDLFLWLLGFFLATWLCEYDAFPNNDIDEVLAPMLVVPSLFVTACLPLWVLRALFRWRIERQRDGQVPGRPPQLSIAGILAATFVVALTLALVRAGSYLSTDLDEATWWLGTGIAAATTVVLCSLTLPVLTWGVCRSKWLVLGTFLSLFWISLLGFGFIALGRAIEGSWPPREAWPYIVSFLGSFGICLLGPLVVARIYQFRLVVGRGQSKSNDLPEPRRIDKPG